MSAAVEALQPTGDCFAAAGRFFLNHRFSDLADDLVLVHGEVWSKGSGVPPHGHAWLECGDAVIDPSNGTVNVYPKQAYYRVGNIGENVHRYGFAELRRLMNESGHYGPWGLVTSTGL